MHAATKDALIWPDLPRIRSVSLAAILAAIRVALHLEALELEI